jgi:5-methyltetrahydropteroyltriglutamate--homocysteine methyltransferase
MTVFHIFFHIGTKTGPRHCAGSTGRNWRLGPNNRAGADCGFGTFAGRVQVDTKIVWMKLRSLAEVVRGASKQLWTKAA